MKKEERKALKFLWLLVRAFHICKPYYSGCTCYSGALEPNEDCEVHGYPIVYQARCSCGKFCRY